MVTAAFMFPERSPKKVPFFASGSPETSPCEGVTGPCAEVFGWLQTKTAGVARHRPFVFIVAEFGSSSGASLANRASHFAPESFRTQVFN